MPLIRDNVQTAYIYLGILALDAFVYMQALNPGGGPDNSTLVMSQRLLTTAFAKGQFGLASAMGVVLAIVTLAFAAIVFLVNWLTGGTRRKVDGDADDQPDRHRATASAESRSPQGPRPPRRQGASPPSPTSC